MEPRTVKFRKLMMYAKGCKLSDDERISLSEMILRRDVESWKSLTEEEVERMLDAFEGYLLITHLRTGQ